MKHFILSAAVLFALHLPPQTTPPKPVSTPQHIVVDSKDNVYVTLKYGIIRITPDGKVTNLTKEPGVIGPLDKPWSNLIIDSKDNLYANDGNIIYKITVGADNKAIAKIFAGQQYTYKLEDGPLSTAGFNMINLMTIDKNDNIYLTDSYDKIKATIGENFITDSYFKNDPAKKYIKYPFHYSVIRKISADGKVTTLKTPDGKYVLPQAISGITTDDQGNIIYAATGFARFVGRINLPAGSFDSIAGQPYKREWCPVYTPGDNSKSELVEPETIITNKRGEILFTDGRLHRVIRIANGKVSTLAGNSIIDPCSQNIGGRAQEGYQDGKATTALFNFPKGIAYDSKGNLFIADMNNHCIRKLSPDGIVTTFAK
jgi:NHL repeat-containing protein